MIHLKTRPLLEGERRFAILVEPEFVPTPKVSPRANDVELLETIKAHGSARIHEFETKAPFQLKANYTVLTPERFEAEWMGD